jgi:trigger factor
MTDITKLSKSEIEIKNSIPWSEWQKYLDRAYEKLSKDLVIPGFRPGKAPKQMIEKRIGKHKILEEAAGVAIEKDYEKILESEKIDAIGKPRAEILKIAEGNDLEYKITTAVMPEVKIDDFKSDISKINKEHKGKETEIEDKEIDHELEHLANSRVKLVTVNREAKSGDNVMIDFQVKREGVMIENGTSKNHPFILGRGVFITGFEENIIGMKEKEEKEFELTFPEDYHEKTLAGKPATFNVKVNLVQDRQIPEINDEFAKSLGDFPDMPALKKSIGEGVKIEKEKKQSEERRAEIVDKLVERSEIELPEILIHSELHKMIDELSFQIEGMGMKLDEYLAKAGKTVNDLEKDWHLQAEKRVKAALVLEQIAKEREIMVPSEKVEEEMNKTLQYYKGAEKLDKNIDLPRLYNYIKGMLVNEEVFKYLENL